MTKKKSGLGVLAERPSIEEANRQRMAYLGPTAQEGQGAPDTPGEAPLSDQLKAAASREKKEKQIQKCIYLGETICKELYKYRLQELPMNTRESAIFREMAVEYLQKRGYLQDYVLAGTAD